MTLMDFLLAHPVEGQEENVVVSERLKEQPFVIRAVTAEEMDRYQRRCRRNREFDGGAFQMLLIINHCIAPDFRSVEALEQSGCATPEALVQYVLKAGEIAALTKAICRFSGFDGEIRTLANEVKN